jgi:pimeloyl-ACP methyl ester carboxylesterase
MMTMTEVLTVGYRDLHPDYVVNFQLNRWINYLGEEALADIEPILPRLTDYPAYRREFLQLACAAERAGRPLAAAYYLRSAEFFMWADDPAKPGIRQSFLELMWHGHGLTSADRHLIRYDDGERRGCLPAYRFPARTDRLGTIVLFGGSDSYIEEFFPILTAFCDAGYDVVAFEGPGQGGALHEYGMAMTTDWHKPVGAVLDHFGLDDVTLIGVSMGGCLVLRAAAFEPRVTRAIAYDVLYDSFSIWLGKMPSAVRALIRTLFGLHAKRPLNALIYRAMGKSLALDWALRQGMMIMGAATPYDYLTAACRYTTSDISANVRQHVLVLAGTEDFGVPVSQYYQQLAALVNAKSVTGRLFTRAEQAHQHCQVGNLGLAVDFMLDWICFHTTEDAEHRPLQPL